MRYRFCRPARRRRVGPGSGVPNAHRCRSCRPTLVSMKVQLVCPETWALVRMDEAASLISCCRLGVPRSPWPPSRVVPNLEHTPHACTRTATAGRWLLPPSRYRPPTPGQRGADTRRLPGRSALGGPLVPQDPGGDSCLRRNQLAGELAVVLKAAKRWRGASAEPLSRRVLPSSRWS